MACWLSFRPPDHLTSTIGSGDGARLHRHVRSFDNVDNGWRQLAC